MNRTSSVVNTTRYRLTYPLLGVFMLAALLLPFSAAAQADVEIVTACPGPFVPGLSFTATHTITNTGPDPAASAVMTVEWIDVELAVGAMAWDTDWACGADMTCNRLAGMPAGVSESVTVVYHLPANAHIVDPDADGNFLLVVDCAVANDPVPNLAIVGPLAMTPAADLVVDVRAISTEVATGGWGLVEVTVRNNGPSDVDGASFASAIAGNASFGGLSGDRFDLYIPAGQTRDYMFGVQVAENAVVGSTITVGSTVSFPAGYTELGDGDEFDSDTFTVGAALPDADVSIAVAVSPATLTAGGAPTTVTLTITNNGPAPAEGVSVHDLFFYPWFVNNIFASGYTINGAFSCVRLQPMPAGAVDTISFNLYAPASQNAAPINNYAYVAADNPDPTPANNTALTSYTVVLEADLVMDVVTISKQVAPGGWGLVECSVRNNGPSDVDTPSFVATILGGGTFGGISGDWDELYIPAGETRKWVYGVQVSESAPVGSVITCGGAVGLPAGYTEVGDGDENDTDTITVVDPLPDADVEVVDVRLMGGGPVVPGSMQTFEIDAINNGPADAAGAVLTTLFFDTAYIPNNSNLPTGWNIGGSGGTWTRQTVWPAGTMQTFWVQLIVPPDAHYRAGSFPIDDFRAFISAANPDVVPANNVYEVYFDAQAQATLTIEKTLLNPDIAPGSTAFYQIAVTNEGPSDVNGIEVLDTPGAGLDAATLVLGPDAANLYIPAGQTRTVMATVKVADTAAVGDSFVNVAAVSATNVEAGVGSTLAAVVNEPATGDVLGTVTHYLPDADVSIAMAMAPAPVTAGGGPTQVTLTITNNGPSPAEGVTVHDLFFFPYRIDFIVSSGYALNGAFSAVRLAPMPVGAVDTITFDLYVPASTAPNSYNNFAYVAADNPDPNTANNSAVASYSVVGEATLDVEKTALVDPVGQGQMLLYEIVVRNEGPSALPAGSVVVVDTLDPLAQFAGASPGCVFTGPPLPATGGIVTCTVDDVLGVNESADFLIQVKVPYGVPTGTILTNSVTADAPSLAPALWTVTTDSDSVQTEVMEGPLADLRITKMVKPDGHVDAGEEFTYWIYVDNLGPAEAVNLTMLDEMISDGAFSVTAIESNRGGTGTLIIPPGAVPGDLPAASVDNELSFEYSLASLAAWDRWTIKVTAVASETIDVNNTARILAENPIDPNLENNYAEGAISVSDVADLVLTKTAMGDAPNQATAGSALTYTLTVANDGPSTATSVVVSDLLPLGVSITGMTPSRGACQLGIPGDPAAPVVWGVGTLAVGEVATLDIQVRVRADVRDGTMLTNSAAAVSDAFDENIGNNRAWNLTEVSAVADLVISAGGTPDPVDEGGLLTYTISFVNNGPSKAHDVAIIDTFPPEVQVVSANLFDILLKSAPLRDAVVFADRIICEIGDLAPGEGGTLIIVVRVPLNTLAITLTNTATIVSDSVDPDPSNNTVITQTDVNGCTLPAAPTGVLASNGVSNTTVFIVWSGVPGATHYDIYRSTVADFATAEFLGATVQTEFLDLDPEPPVIDMSGCHHIECTKAFYWVVAVNGCGDSVPSIPDEGYESLLKSASFSSQYGNLILLGLLLAGLHGFKRASRTRRTL